MPELSPDLLHNIADSRMEVVSWSAAAGEMVLQVTKGIGPETGLLRLRGVGIVHLPPRLEVAAMGVYDSAFPDYPHLQLDEGEFAVAFQGSSGRVYVVTAEEVVYEKIT